MYCKYVLLVAAILECVHGLPSSEKGALIDQLPDNMIDKGYYPGREDMEFMESVEGVHDQIAQLNPKFDLEDVEVSKSDHLEKRGTSRWPPNCNVGRVSGQTAVQPTESIVRLGIDYLNIDDSSCSTPPGCSRLFCAGNSAIFLCNDIAQRADSTRTAWNIGIPCHWVADYASGIAKLNASYAAAGIVMTWEDQLDLRYFSVIEGDE
ncbi:hypothetical protein BGZ57DRAFT_1011731 [Hyaloscypha finlandica]|nr:hypothetical protein BGZ57DRAFT_1011731 [Hyaloscypha finlandica]